MDDTMGTPGAHGTGPGAIAPDGSAVEFYAALPPGDGEAALVHGALRPGAAVLELGSGAGRVTLPLAALGHPVVAVDESPGMLARIDAAGAAGVRTVRSRIQDLDLGERFGGVLLMSFLICYGPREDLLRACHRHLGDDGVLIVQRESPAWFDAAAPSRWERDGVRYRLFDVRRPAADLLTASIEYSTGDRTWVHTFTSRRLADHDLDGTLARAGLRFGRFLDDGRTWFTAHRAPAAATGRD
ncbi:class I SAM-dependent methyltransferase [Actinomadura sp. SCN-SB]|uniref:class I SAM-dependent methyltransferase n=1 Tax=Actinomadura sp. SCN-SB TaxID=3373092 RepID=UPI003750DFFB